MESEAMSGTAWYAVRVRPRCEKAVVSDFETRGLTPYLPLYEKVTRWSDRVKKVLWPLFPGYVFARLDYAQRLPAMQHPNVMYIVSCGGVPQPVDPEELDAVRRMLDAGCRAEPVSYLHAGDTVEVVQGPLAGLHGILLRERNQNRLVVSLTLLHRSVATEIDRACVRLAGPAASGA
jgi:transcription antitermination factor NusG